MTRATIITITTLIWSAGFAATGAFVYTVTKPLPTSAVAAAPTTSPPRMPHSQERTLVLPTVEIIGDIPHGSPPRSTASAAAVRATAATKTTASVKTTTNATKTEETPHERHCTEWRPLEQGSNSVQICD